MTITMKKNYFGPYNLRNDDDNDYDDDVLHHH